MPSASAPDAAPRALPGRLREARANDTAVLAAARRVVARDGAASSVADIAHEAGVGVASIYRRYPTKEALFEALRVEGVRRAADLAASIAPGAGGTGSETGDAEPGGDAAAPSLVGRFLTRYLVEVDGPILQPRTAAGSELSPDLVAASADLEIALTTLVEADQAAKALPAGFTAADVMQLMTRLHPHLPIDADAAADLEARYLGLVLLGLRAHAESGQALPPGPRWESWVDLWRS